MRIWDINPGYLNDKSLLGEHRELHGIVSILLNNKQGYSKHPETLRWQGRLFALQCRHSLLKSEMSLRDFDEKSPVIVPKVGTKWPDIFVNSPGAQYKLLEKKYISNTQGRIPIPQNSQELWAQHKYSIMARDPVRYKEIGKLVAEFGDDHFFDLSTELVHHLRQKPLRGNTRNCLEHLWGYVSDFSEFSGKQAVKMSNLDLLNEVRKLSMTHRVRYLLSSTALSDLHSWLI